jgi:hypothetical protein
MIVGYYLASQRQRVGDARLSAVAMLCWRGLHRRATSRYDGVTLVEREGSTDALITVGAVTSAFR